MDNTTVQDKRLALDVLDIRIIARTRKFDIKGKVPIELTITPSLADVTTTAQTPASLFNCRYIYVEGKGYALTKAYHKHT